MALSTPGRMASLHTSLAYRQSQIVAFPDDICLHLKQPIPISSRIFLDSSMPDGQFSSTLYSGEHAYPLPTANPLSLLSRRCPPSTNRLPVHVAKGVKDHKAPNAVFLLFGESLEILHFGNLPDHIERPRSRFYRSDNATSKLDRYWTTPHWAAEISYAFFGRSYFQSSPLDSATSSPGGPAQLISGQHHFCLCPSPSTLFAKYNLSLKQNVIHTMTAERNAVAVR